MSGGDAGGPLGDHWRKLYGGKYLGGWRKKGTGEMGKLDEYAMWRKGYDVGIRSALMLVKGIGNNKALELAVEALLTKYDSAAPSTLTVVK